MSVRADAPSRQMLAVARASLAQMRDNPPGDPKQRPTWEHNIAQLAAWIARADQKPEAAS